MKKILTTAVAATLGFTLVGGAALAAETQDANLPVKIDPKTGVVSSNGPAEVATAGEKGEVFPTTSGKATEGTGEANIEYKGKAVLDENGKLAYVYEVGPGNVQGTLPELSKEDAEKLARRDEARDPSLKKATKKVVKKQKSKVLPKTSAVR